MSGTRIETATLAVGPPGSVAGGEPSDVATATRLPLTVAEPDAAARGGLVVLHEAGGLDGVDGVLTALAAEGWLAVAPHLYHRGGDGADVAEHVAGLSGDTVIADCDAAFAWLADHDVSADQIGVLGFDLGGAVAFVVAASRQVGAAVSVSPTGVASSLSEGLPSLLDAAPSLACPWLGLFGESDTKVPADEVEALREAAGSSQVATNVITYPGVGHRFDAESDGGEDVTVEAMARVFDWFDSHLR